MARRFQGHKPSGKFAAEPSDSVTEYQQAGWVGKGKKPGDDAASDHVSRPLSTLKDPALFGPPPKNVNYHGGAALPNEITPHRGGIGAPLTQEQIAAADASTQAAEYEEPEQSVRATPPLPYRANTTGLATSHLPPPPVRRGQPVVEPPQPAKPKPGLPPRLPARQNTNESISATSPPPYYDAVTAQNPQPTTGVSLNQSAMNRLGKAGVSVPGLGIGRNNSNTSIPDNPWKSESSQSQASAGGNTMSALQSRFSRMNSNEGTAQAQPTSAAPPPTIQQTQSAFNTAQNFHRDPSSVSMNDAKNAASTANNAARSASAFRDKHSGSIAAAEQRGKAFNNKYQIQSRLEKFLDKHAPLEDDPQQQQQQQVGQPSMVQPTPQQQPQQHWPPQPQHQAVATPPVQSPIPELAASISRKPPPPPPPKKPSGMHGNTVGSPPPPVPLGTKPGYS